MFQILEALIFSNPKVFGLLFLISIAMFIKRWPIPAFVVMSISIVSAFGWFKGNQKLKIVKEAVPIYPNAKFLYHSVTPDGQDSWSFQIKDLPFTVIDYYRQLPLGKGWQLLRAGKKGVLPVILFEKDKWVLMVNAGTSMVAPSGPISVHYQLCRREVFERTMLGSWVRKTTGDLDPTEWMKPGPGGTKVMER